MAQRVKTYQIEIHGETTESIVVVGTAKRAQKQLRAIHRSGRHATMARVNPRHIANEEN